MSVNRVLFVAAEAYPLVKVGGLGDVIGSLPPALRQIGYDARTVIPRYGIVNLDGYETTRLGVFSVPFLGGRENITVLEVALRRGTPIYLLENERFFSRMAVYGEPDDAVRFLLFSLAALETPKYLDWQPDVIHAHDWHTGLVPARLKAIRHGDSFYSTCASVFTIHNLAYQGWFDDAFAGRAGLHGYLLPPGDPLRGQTYNFMALGICHGDVISTVSETYSREILTPQYGRGLEELLRRRQDRLVGIINGIDYEQFDPATDPHIEVNYDVSSLDRRVQNKLALQERIGLPVNARIPLVGMAGRLVDQKGPDIAAEALAELLPATEMQFILQGTGDTRYQELLEKLEDLHAKKARVFFVLDFSLAQLIFAGCDIFLMPSLFEPCGLTPLIAMRYGAIPVVRRTGGLADTVPDCSPDLSRGLGFVFQNYDTGELVVALKRALAAFGDKEKWRQLMVRVMRNDSSWHTLLPRYEALYQRAQFEARG
ncbi:MAG: glycogen/starch synthase [Dehalococcoidales bacterium]|nr:glycogen/starch synthase [Dehalococcoidales bacterium]